MWTSLDIIIVAPVLLLSFHLEQVNSQTDALKAIVEANNGFGIDLYDRVRHQEGNLIMSPFSAGAVLALTLQGAKGRTAEQLTKGLHLPADAALVRDGYSQVFDSLNANSNVKIKIANKIYAKDGGQLNPDFRKVAVDRFRAELDELDFAKDNEKSRQIINHWVEGKTENKIKELFAKLDPATAIVLVNAIYFKGGWAKPFFPEATRPKTFHVSPTTKIEVPMMYQESYFNYAKLPEINVQVLELPYKGDKMSMIVMLPDDKNGLPKLETDLKSINMTYLRKSLKFEEVSVYLPKFKIESKFELHKTLPELGIVDLFNNGADLSGISNARLKVDQVVQKAYIETTEEGTEAAAATGVVAVPVSAIIGPPPKIFTADHPFAFLLLNENNILFIGRVEQPKIV